MGLYVDPWQRTQTNVIIMEIFLDLGLRCDTKYLSSCLPHHFCSSFPIIQHLFSTTSPCLTSFLKLTLQFSFFSFQHVILNSVLTLLPFFFTFKTILQTTIRCCLAALSPANTLQSSISFRAPPHLGYSDVLKQVKTWPAGATSALLDCFECTEWEAATNGVSFNLEEYTSSVTSYISKCVDDVTQKCVRKTKRLCLQSRGQDGLKNSKGQTVPLSKPAHSNKIHNHFQYSGDTQRMWQVIQAITNYKKSPACDHDASLPDVLNDLYAWFEGQNNVKTRKTTPLYSDRVLCLSTAEVRKTLCRVNPRKSAGPDNIPGRVLREYAEQLADVFTDIFNISLSSNVVPTCPKTMIIAPVLKKSTVSCLNDYRPISNIVMTCLRGSSAFNTIIPQHLIDKLSLLGLNTSLCNWILDFLTGRPQLVRIGNSISSTTALSTGAPQGCVLSPLLFTMLTHNCVAIHSLNHIVKFADDMTMSGHSPLIIDGSSVEIIKSTKFLGVHLVDNLTWSLKTSSISKKAQQHLYFLRRLRGDSAMD
ncbi:hypothetical protein C0J45_0469 [Silurus meridionalis]|uniref:Reverse transcriptase domain-containing protein n=1 Tax=Silurus meridionalis TaxID=175797 RepID=A0A8T0BZW9_SILME|nr:hypothetical protein HF521_000497 [Silurus meridionalis]KAI5109072.1 hypothetical protein C0J45_0469 [Silurus meridionalis]